MKTRLILLVALAALLAGAWFGLRHRLPVTGRAPIHPRPVLVVDVAPVRKTTVPWRWHAVGQVEAYHSVSIRPQVSGILQAVPFHEGERVEKGQVLFRIDPASYRAAVAKARAQLDKDRATLANALWQEQRQKQLRGQRYSSAQDYENARALVAETRATIALDQAALKQASIELGYTEIRSPIAGYTGELSVKTGNLVQAADPTPLVTIRQIRPALVSFSIPQSELARVRAARAAGDAISVRLTGDGQAGKSGPLVFIDNSMDSQTGTILLKARFANTDGVLWPGQYLDLDLISGREKGALLIPETALQQGQDGPFVFLVRNGRVRVQSVVSQRQVGHQVVVARGLSDGERVVTHVPRRLADGDPVKVRVVKDLSVP